MRSLDLKTFTTEVLTELLAALYPDMTMSHPTEDGAAQKIAAVSYNKG